MRWLHILPLLLPLTQQPAELPKDKRVAETNCAESTAHTKQAKTNQTSPTQPTAALTQAPVGMESQGSAVAVNNHTQTGDRQTSNEDRATQRKLTWFTGVLAVVGVLQLFVMFLTWQVYFRQAGIMEEQRAMMKNQWRTMQDQLTEMKASGQQTDKMIAEMSKQVGHLETSAKAAKDSADIFVLSERAWVQIHITKPPTTQTNRDRTAIEHVWFWPDVINVGRTPATITKIIVVTCQIPKPLGDHSQMPPPLPPEPIYDADRDRRVIGIERSAILAPQTGLTPIPIELKGHEWKAISEREMTLFLYGYVDYIDVVGNPHFTRFCELYWMPFHPDDPNPQGFITAGNTPAPYTYCT
jgi:hypothetical protein